MSKISTIAKCLNIVYKQRLLKEHNLHVMEVVNGTLDKINIEDNRITSDQSLDAVVADLKSYILEVMNSDIDTVYTLPIVESNIKLLTLGNSDIRNAMLTMLGENTESKPKIKKAIARDLSSIEAEYNKSTLESRLYAAYKNLRAGKSASDMDETVETLSMAIADVTKTTNNVKAVLDYVDMDNSDQVTNLASDAQNRYNDKGSLRYGWEKINEFIGGSSRLGDFILIPASQHNYKTGISCTIFTQLCTFNRPSVFDEKKKPLLIRITAEDPLTNNIEFMYKQMRFTDTGEVVEFVKEDPITIAKEVKKKLTETGFSVRLIEVNPNLLTVAGLFDIVTGLEDEGYEIKGIVFDYLAKLNRKGIYNDGIAGSQLRLMYETVRNFMSARKILFITTVQLSTEVDTLRAVLPPTEVLPAAIIGSKLDSGKSVMQIVDVCFGCNIIRHNDESWLHIYRGKLRSSVIVAHNKKSFFLKFSSSGMPIPDTEQGVYTLPAAKIEEKEEDLF